MPLENSAPCGAEKLDDAEIVGTWGQWKIRRLFLVISSAGEKLDPY